MARCRWRLCNTVSKCHPNRLSFTNKSKKPHKVTLKATPAECCHICSICVGACSVCVCAWQQEEFINLL